MDKIVFQDGKKEKVLKGKIIGQDDLFYEIQVNNFNRILKTHTSYNYKIAKNAIISIRSGEE